MKKHRALVLPAIIVGCILIFVGVLYFVDTASSLPSFFPGHQSGSSHHHTKHGIVAIILGLLAFAFAWFQTGPTAESRGTGSGARTSG